MNIHYNPLKYSMNIQWTIFDTSSLPQIVISWVGRLLDKGKVRGFGSFGVTWFSTLAEAAKVAVQPEFRA